jgi:DNA polymerase-3 subunit gamma/tau
LAQGKKSVASIMNACNPTVKDNCIHFSLPNSLMKNQLERAQIPLIKYLRENLNNYKIEINIKVDEESSKKYAYTPKEKYQKLKQKNIKIELLKKTFDLDI